MKLSEIQFDFVGFNGFGQFQKLRASDVNVKYSSKIKSNNLSNILNDVEKNLEIKTFSFHFGWFYNCYVIKNYVYIRGGLNEKLKFDDMVVKVTGNDDYCLILLENGNLFQYKVLVKELKKLNFLNIEETKLNENEKIIDIATGKTFSVAVTNLNSIYNIPTKLITLPKNEKIKKVCCGNEFGMLLTFNGDIYTWGSGIRGQTGKGDLVSEELPTILNALSGIKINDIDCGGWHSGAVSAYGDLYMWGWNINGQLGLKFNKNINTSNLTETDTTNDKNHSVYSLPQLINLFDPEKNSLDGEISDINITNVALGTRHSIIKTDTGNFFASGWNRHGQLGLPSYSDNHVNIIETEIYDEFTKVELNLKNDLCLPICGDWSTVFIN